MAKFNCREVGIGWLEFEKSAVKNQKLNHS
jgi:hypothetical protein